MMSKEQSVSSSKLHILMFPWFAVGHIVPYLHLSNELAKRGHKVSFLLPNKAQLLLQPLNLRPHSLISFYPLSVPHVDGLPVGTETASDIHISLTGLLGVAFDLTRPQVEHVIGSIKPGFVFYDFAYWVPEITAPLGIKSVSYNVVSVPALCNIAALGKAAELGSLLRADPGVSASYWLDHCPTPMSSVVALRRNEVCEMLDSLTSEFGRGVTLLERLYSTMKLANAIALRTCTELEGKFCDYLMTQFDKHVLLTGSVLFDVESSTSELSEPWASWLGGYAPRSVVYCKLGSQTILEKKQFQETLLGFELTGCPFIVALKPPIGCSTLEEAFPEGFEDRVRERGMVVKGWVPHQELLKHPTVGCYVSHCGYGAMWESLMGNPEIVLVPEMRDQILSTRMLSEEMKVAVEVEKDDNGLASRDNLCKAVKKAMDEEAVTRKNHATWRDMLKGKEFMSGYIDNFLNHLQRL